MIETILGNKVLLRIIRLLYQSPNRFFSFLEIEQYIGAGREGIRLALRTAEYFELVYVEVRGGKKYKLKMDNVFIKTVGLFYDTEKKFLQGIDPKKLSVIANVESDCLKSIEKMRGIWLFGSVAKGKAKEGSDIDLLILVEKNTPNIKLLIEEIAQKYEKRFVVQCIVMDVLEFNKRKKEPFVMEILKSGVELHKI